MKLLRATLPCVLVLASAGSASVAQERRPPPKQQEGVVQQPAPKARSAPRAATALSSPIPRVAGPGDLPLDPPVAPRLGGLAEQRYGGAACRTSCSSTYIFCQQQDEVTSCGASWARCLSACPPVSSSE